MRILALVLATLLLGACAQTRVASYVDPAYRGGPKLTAVAVAADTARLGEQQALESAAVAALSAQGVRAVRMIDLVPPTRAGGSAAQTAALRTSGVQAVLRITVDRRAVAARYIPPAYGPDAFYPYGGFYGPYGGYGYYPGAYGGPISSGGWVEEPLARYSASLQDLRSGATIWKADAGSRGSSSTDFDDLAADAAKELVGRLHQDGLIGG
jgi:hypothetical protein